jgi:hypothetical protein
VVAVLLLAALVYYCKCSGGGKAPVGGASPHALSPAPPSSPCAHAHVGWGTLCSFSALLWPSHAGSVCSRHLEENTATTRVATATTKVATTKVATTKVATTKVATIRVRVGMATPLSRGTAGTRPALLRRCQRGQALRLPRPDPPAGQLRCPLAATRTTARDDTGHGSGTTIHMRARIVPHSTRIVHACSTYISEPSYHGKIGLLYWCRPEAEPGPGAHRQRPPRASHQQSLSHHRPPARIHA